MLHTGCWDYDLSGTTISLLSSGLNNVIATRPIQWFGAELAVLIRLVHALGSLKFQAKISGPVFSRHWRGYNGPSTLSVRHHCTSSSPSVLALSAMAKVAHAPFLASIVLQNVLEDFDGNGSTPRAGIMDSNDEDLNKARGALAQVPIKDPHWLNRSRALASLLLKCFQEKSQDALMAECIDVQRQICALCTKSDPDKAVFLFDLALSLRTRFKLIGEDSLLSEAIALDRQALSLRPIGHPDRSVSCNNLALSLWTRFKTIGEESLLSEAISLHREALSLRPSGHPDRSISCTNLAISLWTRFKQTGEQSLLSEAIDLSKEALSLQSGGHPARSTSCNSLAIALESRFWQTGEDTLLAEAINLHREALSLRPTGDLDRSMTCNNLANLLTACFKLTGNETLLVRVIDLHREALSLRPGRHPDRAMSCMNLANALERRFKQTGEDSLVLQAIELHREALSLRPSEHPDRSISCLNLASALWMYFKQTGERLLLAEAIDLSRESLSLQPNGHPLRASSCSVLARALWTRFMQTGEVSLLTEAINLHTEALSLRPRGHPGRLETCDYLADTLKTCFEQTGDESLLIQAINLSKEAIETYPQDHPGLWNPIINLVHIYLDRHFSQHNLACAISYLQHALSLPPDNCPERLSEAAELVALIDLPTLSQDSLSQLLQCFTATLDLASHTTGFVLDPECQLRYLSNSQHLGPCAYWCAIACGLPEIGLELIEHARAMMWNQALQTRSPQLSGAPPELAFELEKLLMSMNVSRAVKISALPSSDSISSSFTRSLSMEQDVRYRNSTRIHGLIRQIRAIPGHERFMRGLSYEALTQCATFHAVVVLVAAQDECHAMIIRPNEHTPVIMKLRDITPNDLKAISITGASATRLRGANAYNVHQDRMGFRFHTSSSFSRVLPVLMKLWTKVVKPIITSLQLQVCKT
jgi:tetratricopeptide (TPR) repeat protein